MPVLEACEHCGRPTPIYRFAAVIYDGRVAKLCPVCVSSEQHHISVPFAPRVDQGAIQPSTPRTTW